jgi:ribosome biogenesis GTPase A
MAENKSISMKSAHNMSGRINWFPGHMAKALREVRQKVGRVDIVIEVRDARVPLASGNPSLNKVIQGKPRLIVMNKSNLADPAVNRQWEEWFQDQGQAAIFVNALASSSLKRIPEICRKLMKDRWASIIKKGIKPPPMRMIVVGIPNTGKSTLINRLTKRSATRTGDRPGVTRHQEWIVLGKDLELLDTPGIMPPRIENEEQGMWLCAIHAIKDEIVGKEQIASYLVDKFKHRNAGVFMKRYQIDSLDQTPEELLMQMGNRLNFKKQGGEIDYMKTCNHFLKDFRKGILGTYTFELPVG